MPRKPIWKTCKFCEREFFAKEGARSKYCSKDCVRESIKGSRHHLWKGSGATYSAFHNRVERARGKPSKCDECGTEEANSFEWANVSGKYDDVFDYRRLCGGCHKRFDKIHLNFGNVSKLSESDVAQIRKHRSRKPPTPLRVLSEKFGVSDATVSMAATGRTWTSHPVPPAPPIPMGAKNMSESRLQTELLLRAPKEFLHLRIFRRNVVVARVEGRTIHAGVKGQADLYGILRGGKSIEIEIKSATGSLSPEQKAWASWCEEWSVPHMVLKARRGEIESDTIDRWIEELRTKLSEIGYDEIRKFTAASVANSVTKLT